MPTKVVIIGAGIAGLAAARHLKGKVDSVVVLEARNRIGGRIHTRRDWDIPTDMGAQWIHGSEGNPVSKLCQEGQVFTVETDYKDIVFFDGEHKLSDEQAAQFWKEHGRFQDLLRSTVDTIQRDVTLGYAYEQLLAAEQKDTLAARAFNWLLAWNLEVENGADRDDMSLVYAETDKYFPGKDALIPYGYDQILKGLAEGLDIRLEEVVTHVETTADHALVRSLKDEHFADAVICTLPLGVLKADKVRFTPPLPAPKQEAIRRLEMGCLTKVFLKFPDVFWDRHPQYIGFLDSEGLGFPLFVNHAKRGQVPVLEACTAGNLGREIEMQGEAFAQDAVMRVLRTMYGETIPDPQDVVITDWTLDPFALGSYSFSPVDVHDEEYLALAEPAGPRLYFAGEATDPWYTGTAHGALMSGIREAERLLK